MATHLDLEEQEQLDQLKSFWKQYGNLVTWVLIALLGSFAAWNGWNWWQRDQSIKAGAMFDELDKAAHSGNVEKVSLVFADMKERYSRTAFAEQGGLLAAKVQFEKGQVDASLASLAWVATNAVESEYQSIAYLRSSGVLLDQKKYAEALKQLDAVGSKDGSGDFGALVDDRRGDILTAQGYKGKAKASYDKAWHAMVDKVDYRRLIEAKLTALGASPVEVIKGAAASEVAK